LGWAAEAMEAELESAAMRRRDFLLHLARRRKLFTDINH